MRTMLASATKSINQRVRYSLSAAFVACALVAGCKVGPNYHRPALDAPADFRRAASDTNATNGAESFADLGWWETFNDPQLTAYVEEALTNSWDVKIAADRILQAEANLRITRSQFFPNVSAGGDLLTTRTSKEGAVSVPKGFNPQREYGDVFVAMNAYEIDLWGRIRRANEAARAQMLATIEAQNAVRQRLVASVAAAYLSLLELDLELKVSKEAYEGRTNSLEITKSRENGGVAALQDVYQAQILVSTADATITDIHRQIEQQENQLSILLARNPGSIQRGTPLTAQKLRAEVPPGLPSSLMERRPDLRVAEEQLVAANADIGQAKAAFYPQLTLTGVYGHQTVALSDLFTGATKAWQFGPAVTMPLFTGGRLRGNLKFAQARFQESLHSYQQTVQSAFREVSDGLIDYQRSQEFRAKQEEVTQAHRDATAMANVRYQGGVASYLEVLYNEQELFTAELRLAQARRSELLSVVELYRALGGGWQQPPSQQASAK
jgi:NodT family efflux transporter outer membrane factor (OMF) lipoprotein